MKMKRLLSIVVTLCMVLSMLPVGAWAACAHEYVAEVYPATCTEGGFTVFTCSLCGDAYMGDEVEPLNHPEYVDGFCALCGSGQPAVENGDYYEISNAAQLYWFAQQVNSGNTDINGKLMADIVVNENVLKEDGTLNGDGSHFKVWTPIGNNVKGFAGIFDGNGKTVSGLYFNNTSNSYIGLFGYVYYGEVKNVGVVDSYLSGSEYVGGVVGYSRSTVSDCYNTGSVSGSEYVGGVVGRNDDGTVSNSYNTGSVGGEHYVGGVAGINTDGGCSSNCYNAGSVSGTDSCVGGVVGYNYSTVSDCYNTGSVSGIGNCVGGVVGHNYYGSVSSCYNTGSVSGSYEVGGVVGIGGTVSDCYNTGSVSGTGGRVGGVAGAGHAINCYNTGSVSGNGDSVGGVVGGGGASNCYNTGSVSVNGNHNIYIGGVVGYNYRNSTVSNCYNTGSVSGISYVGGVVGFNDQQSTVSNSYNTGSVSGNGDSVGGVVGSNDFGIVSNSYNTGSVSGSDFVGGVVGIGEGITISNCYNTGSVSGSYCVGGVVGSSISGTVINSYNTGSVSGATYVGGVVGGNNEIATEIKNCYYRTGCARDGDNKLQFGIGCETQGSNVRDTAGVTTGKSSDAFARGEVCVLLQGEQTDPIWGQIIGSDPSPVLGGEPVYSYNGNYFNKDGLPHEHEYEAVTTPNSCTTDGYTTYTCTFCGDSYTSDVVTAPGHSWVDANCQSVKTCSVCGITEGGLGDHGYNKVVTAPTCTSDGYTTYICKFCNHTYNGDFVFATGHSWENPTCTQAMHCTVCDTTIGNALGHYFGEVTVHKPTAGNQGYSEHSCAICGFNEKFDFVDFVGVTVSGQLTSTLAGDTTVELIQNGEVAYSITVSGSEYAIEGVVAGDYTLRITKKNHAPVEFAITVGDGAVTQDATICPVGDVSGDGVVNIKDFQRLLRHVNKTNPLTEYELACGDVTGDGVCNIKDFQRLLRHVNKTSLLY